MLRLAPMCKGEQQVRSRTTNVQRFQKTRHKMIGRYKAIARKQTERRSFPGDMVRFKNAVHFEKVVAFQILFIMAKTKFEMCQTSFLQHESRSLPSKQNQVL